MTTENMECITDWEKLQQGLVYNDFSQELFSKRVDAKKLFKAYNKTTDEEVEERQALLSKLFKAVGKGVHIEPDFRCEFGDNITIGNNVYINFDCIILDCSEVTIGNDVLIGPNLGLYAVNHELDPEERIKGACIGKPIRIEDNVWIGGDVKILAGITVGEGSVIGAGSVVTKNIPPRVVAAGNPCKVIRPITEADKLGFYG